MKAISRVRSGSLLHRSKCIQDVCPESPGVYLRWNFPEIHCFFSIANVSGKWSCPKSSGYIIQNGAIFSGGTETHGDFGIPHDFRNLRVGSATNVGTIQDSCCEITARFQVSPDVVSFSAAISACQKAWQWQQTLQVFTAPWANQWSRKPTGGWSGFMV